MKNEFTKFKYFVLRNIKIYFADKTVFFVSLMSPLILLLLFVLFLKGVYVSSFANTLPEGFVFTSPNIADSFVAGWLVSALLAVSCVTVSIGACIIMVQDKITGVVRDIKSTPIKSGTISIGYFVATFVSAFMIILIVLGLGFIYIAISGWYLSGLDILLIFINAIILTLFGCALATVINSFIKSDGGLTAVSALSASIYGFICGAYMPLSQFGAAFSNIFGFNPGLYGGILFKNLFLRGTFTEMEKQLPSEAITSIKDGFDVNFYFFGNYVPTWVMWLVLGLAVVVISVIAILIANRDKFKKTDHKVH